MAYINWNIDPEITNLFGFSLRYYGVLFVAGLILCIVMLRSIFRREGIDDKKLDILTIYGTFGIILGARLGHCLFYEPDYYFANPLEMLLPIQKGEDGGYAFTGYQGLASHGGAAGLVLAVWLYSKKTDEPMLRTFDFIAIVGPLAGMFIRLANLANSEIVGTPSSLPWAFVFKRYDGVPRHPAQLYEALAYLLIFVLLLLLYNRRRLQPGYGIFLGISLILIFAARFIIEFVKERQVAFEQNMTLDMGQWLSIPFFISGIILLIRGINKSKAMSFDTETKPPSE